MRPAGSKRDTPAELSAGAARPDNERCVFDLRQPGKNVKAFGFSSPEPAGSWTDGKYAELTLTIPAAWQNAPMLLLRFFLRGFIDNERLPEQRVAVSVDGVGCATWSVCENYFRTHVLAVKPASLETPGALRIGFALHNCAQPAAFGVSADTRYLAVMIEHIVVETAAFRPPDDALFWQYGRPVGGEAAKSLDKRIETGFWSRFITGPNVLDVGFRGYGGKVLPIVEGAIGIDLDYPGYDGKRLPFDDGSQDAVFSSHCLEHIADYIGAIQDWFRVTKIGGHIITIVPDARIYERKRRPPSRWNDDHKRFYSPAALLREFETALHPNTYSVRLLEENDEGYRYEDDPDVHPFGCYEIVLVIQKIAPPSWRLQD